MAATSGAAPVSRSEESDSGAAGSSGGGAGGQGGGGARRSRRPRRAEWHECPAPGCKKRYKTACALRNHIRGSHEAYDQRPYPCAQCAYKAVAECDLRSHMMRKHTSPSPDDSFFTCRYCQVKSKNIYVLQKHIERQHVRRNLNRSWQPCDFCFFQGTAWQIARHVTMKHTLPEP